MNWLKGAAALGARSLDWFDQNISKQTFDFLKKIPVVGDVVAAAEPLRNVYSQSLGALSDNLNNVNASKRRKGPSAQTVLSGLAAIPGVLSKVTDLPNSVSQGVAKYVGAQSDY